MTNQEIATVFEQVANLLEFDGANPFRIRSYRGNARRIADMTEPLATIATDDERKLTELEGIGKETAEKIQTLLTTGSLPMLEELLERIPKTVLSLLRVPNLGPKKAAVLYNTLGISTLDQLRAACEAEELQKLKGFAKKTEEKILAGIDIASQADKRIYWSKANIIANALFLHFSGKQEDYPLAVTCLQASLGETDSALHNAAHNHSKDAQNAHVLWEKNPFGIRQFQFAGSFRRGKETIGDLDILVDADDAALVMDRLAKFDSGADTLVRGETKMSIRLTSGLQIDLRVVPSKSFGAALQYFTGSKEHNVKLRSLAKERGLRLNEWGLFKLPGNNNSDNDDKNREKDILPIAELLKSDAFVAGERERDIYAAFNLPCFPPELREGRQEYQMAEQGPLPKLIQLSDIRGDLHMHTNASDGKATLQEMVNAAIERGLSYIAITDHSKRVTMANGLDGKRLREQWAEIDVLRKTLPTGFQVLKGVECDILEKGGMDIPDEVLAEADWVIASVHYGQNQSREQITDRILGAIRNPYVHIIAHPTGRLINRREAYAVDMEAVMQAAAEHGKMLELNANPARLDLNEINCAAAKRHGIPIVISTDAHRIEGMDVMRYGILQARRAGLTAGDVANTRKAFWG